jgi:hypothetical protein
VPLPAVAEAIHDLHIHIAIPKLTNTSTCYMGLIFAWPRPRPASDLSANKLLADVLKEMEKKTGLSVPSEAII